ncbi:hypothetical protein [Phenylobacterium sp.]|jgi:hypothetical protein|uniref:hypothetical protein n=1 Tax=Phenylobacterium sp. TaxID=1871053 RepID=UPI002F4115AF
MRPLLAAFLALASASSASAQVVQDRYGPPRPAPRPLVMASLGATPGASVAPPYRGPMLGWSGKPAPAATPRHEGPPQAALEPHRAPPRAAPQPQPAPRMIGPQAAAPPAVVPAQQVARAPVAAPAQIASSASRTAGASPRFYSLHREYGMRPDAIPEQSAQPRYVLIGPADAPEAADDKAPASKSSAVF